MAASTPLPLSFKALSDPSGGAFPTPGQPLRIKKTLLMAAGFNARDDNNGPLSQSNSPLLCHSNRDSTEDILKSGPLPSSASPDPVERTQSADPNEEDTNLRTTCDSCTISKIKCDGGHPCKRCSRRRSQCVYREKKRCGPKRRRSSREDGDDDDASTAATSAEDWSVLSPKVLSTKERQFLAKFYNSVNKFIPITCHTVIRDAMNPLPLDVIDGSSASEEDKNIHHARKALLLGCVALGAVFCGDASSASAYMARAQIHLKDCFDALLPEVVSCYLVMVVYHLHFLDRSKVFRYIGFAQQAFRELKPAQQAAGSYVRDSVRMLSTFLHVACDSEIRVEEIDIMAESSPEPGTNTQSRILAVFSYVLLMLYRRSNPTAAAKASPQCKVPNTQGLAAMADEADLLLSMMENPGSFAVIVIKTLRGYFLLLKGKDHEVQEAVSLPVAKALDADQGVLNFPLCWHMCQCVVAFLHRQGVHAVAAGMERVMNPLHQSLAYANSRCTVGTEVYGVYAGNKTPSPKSGLSPRASGSVDSNNGYGSGSSEGGSNNSGSAVNNGALVNVNTSPPRDERLGPISTYRGTAPATDFSSASSSPSSRPAMKLTTVGAPVTTADTVSPHQAGSIIPQPIRGPAATRQNSVSPPPGERGRRRHIIGTADSNGPSRVVRNSPLEPWGAMTQHGDSASGSNSGANSIHQGNSSGYGSSVGNGGTNSGHGHHSNTLDNQLFVSRFSAGGAGVSPAPATAAAAAAAAASSFSTLTLDDVSGLHRQHMMFDLGSQPQAFEDEGRNTPFIGGNFTLGPAGLSGAGVGARQGGASAGAGGAGVQHLTNSAGLSSDPSSPRPTGPVGGDTESSDSTLMGGMLDM